MDPSLGNRTASTIQNSAADAHAFSQDDLYLADPFGSDFHQGSFFPITSDFSFPRRISIFIKKKSADDTCPWFAVNIDMITRPFGHGNVEFPFPIGLSAVPFSDFFGVDINPRVRNRPVIGIKNDAPDRHLLFNLNVYDDILILYRYMVKVVPVAGKAVKAVAHIILFIKDKRAAVKVNNAAFPVRLCDYFKFSMSGVKIEHISAVFLDTGFSFFVSLRIPYTNPHAYGRLLCPIRASTPDLAADGDTVAAATVIGIISGIVGVTGIHALGIVLCEVRMTGIANVPFSLLTDRVIRIIVLAVFIKADFLSATLRVEILTVLIADVHRRLAIRIIICETRVAGIANICAVEIATRFVRIIIGIVIIAATVPKVAIQCLIPSGASCCHRPIFHLGDRLVHSLLEKRRFLDFQVAGRVRDRAEPYPDNGHEYSQQYHTFTNFHFCTS